MAPEPERNLRLEIGHVLFIDLVGYSKPLVKQQSELLRELNEVVARTNEFQQADSFGKLIRLPTGDRMALVFRTEPSAIDHLEELLSSWGGETVSVATLRIDPVWDRHRNDPRFKTLLAKHAVGENSATR